MCVYVRRCVCVKQLFELLFSDSTLLYGSMVIACSGHAFEISSRSRSTSLLLSFTVRVAYASHPLHSHEIVVANVAGAPTPELQPLLACYGRHDRRWQDTLASLFHQSFIERAHIIALCSHQLSGEGGRLIGEKRGQNGRAQSMGRHNSLPLDLALPAQPKLDAKPEATIAALNDLCGRTDTEKGRHSFTWYGQRCDDCGRGKRAAWRTGGKILMCEPFDWAQDQSAQVHLLPHLLVELVPECALRQTLSRLASLRTKRGGEANA